MRSSRPDACQFHQVEKWRQPKGITASSGPGRSNWKGPADPLSSTYEALCRFCFTRHQAIATRSEGSNRSCSAPDHLKQSLRCRRASTKARDGPASPTAKPTMMKLAGARIGCFDSRRAEPACLLGTASRQSGALLGTWHESLHKWLCVVYRSFQVHDQSVCRLRSSVVKHEALFLVGLLGARRQRLCGTLTVHPNRWTATNVGTCRLSSEVCTRSS